MSKKKKKNYRQQNVQIARKKQRKQAAEANIRKLVSEEIVPIELLDDEVLAWIAAEKLAQELCICKDDTEAADETGAKEQDSISDNAEMADSINQKNTPKIDYISIFKERMDDLWNFVSETRRVSVPLILVVYTAIVVAITIPFEHARVLKEIRREVSELEQITTTESSVIALGKDVETELASGSKAMYTGYEFTDSVKAQNSNEFGSTYENDSEVNTYLDIKLQYTHNGAESLSADKVAAMTAKISGAQYSGFAAVETDEGQNIEFANSVEIAPGATVQMHYIFNVPKELKNSGEGLAVDVALDKNVYVINIR